jgi:hypothetical protein
MMRNDIYVFGGTLLHLKASTQNERGADRFGLGELGIVLGLRGHSYVILGQKRIARLTRYVLEREVRKGIITLCWQPEP